MPRMRRDIYSARAGLYPGPRLSPPAQLRTESDSSSNGTSYDLNRQELNRQELNRQELNR